MRGGHDDYAVEPIRGLPEMLPQGEYILWQGAPEWWGIAKGVFHIRAVAVYFILLMAWRGSIHLNGAGHTANAIVAALSLLPMALLGLGMLALLAYLSARTSVYTITNRRVVMRVGVALPTAINIPFNIIRSAGLAAGTGDITLTLDRDDRVPYSTLWPHARPWRFNHPEPLLRALPDSQRVAQLLGEALRASQPGTTREIPMREPKPASPALRPMPGGIAAAGLSA